MIFFNLRLLLSRVVGAVTGNGRLLAISFSVIDMMNDFAKDASLLICLQSEHIK